MPPLATQLTSDQHLKWWLWKCCKLTDGRTWREKSLMTFICGVTTALLLIDQLPTPRGLLAAFSQFRPTCSCPRTSEIPRWLRCAWRTEKWGRECIGVNMEETEDREGRESERAGSQRDRVGIFLHKSASDRTNVSRVSSSTITVTARYCQLDTVDEMTVL